MCARTEYVIDTAGLTDGDRVIACRTVLTMTADDVVTFETDIPWSMSAQWPDDVRDAAVRLSALTEPRRGEGELYRQTGMRAKVDSAEWDAFVSFAPFAFDASAWTDKGSLLVSLSDCADAIVVRLTSAQMQRVAEVVGEDRLIPAKTWRRR